MSLVSESLTYVTEHFGGQRCEVVRNQALSGQCIIELLRISSETSSRLLNLKMRFSPVILEQLLERVWTYTLNKAMPQMLSMAGMDDTHLWFHVRFESENQMLVLWWRWQLQSQGILQLKLERLYHLGKSERDPLDLCHDHLDCVEQAMLKAGQQPLEMALNHEDFSIEIPLHDWSMKLLVASQQRSAPRIESGKTCVHVQDGMFHFEYDSNEFDLESQALSASQMVDWDNLMPTVISSDGAHASEVSGVSRLYWDAPEIQCPLMAQFHRALGAEEKVSQNLALEALEEAKAKLPQALSTALLDMVHRCLPELTYAIKLDVLTLASSDSASSFVLSMLEDIYRREQSDALLLTLLQRQLNNSTFCPHRLIRIGLETVETLSGSLMMYSLAVRRLDSLKSTVLQYGSIRELIAFALAYHHAQYSGMAMQCLKQWMKQATRSADIAIFGYHLAKVMLEHHEPLQKIIDVCTYVLDADPLHSATLEILAQCLEDSERLEEAVETWHHCFGFLIHAWELARVKYQTMPTLDGEYALQQCHARAVRTAQTLEHLLDGIERAPQRCLIYREHLRLQPDAMPVLARYLKDLESMHYFHEMAQCCEEFLALNQQNMAINDEISIRLTLHNIYDQELHRDQDAMKHLARAKEIGALDSRVITAEIDRCRRRGQRKDQIELMVALIDALPASECVEPTLELVRLHESTQADDAFIVSVLRKTNARCPHHPSILLELRRYLRKMGQNFELASVLEKLAKVTKDLQTRRSILLEASEVHEKLGNNQIARTLYHEAQLCSPINPNGKTDIPQSLRIGFGQSQEELPERLGISRLASVVLTSRSLPTVDGLPEEASHSSHSELEGLELHISSADQQSLSVFLDEQLGLSSSSLSMVTLTPQSIRALEYETEVISDSQSPIEDQIMAARLRGNTQTLLERLLRGIEGMPESEQPPRMLQEIACIYLYELHDMEKAKVYLERACRLSDDVANGEQTLNALETIYQSMKLYRELSDVYQKKSEILTISEEKRRYEIRLAQIRYEHLKETGLAIDILNRILKNAPANETALQLLAQIYIETHQGNQAMETLERIANLLRPHTKAYVQHLRRLVSIYIEYERFTDAKRYLNILLNQEDYIDKLAVLEQYKGMCREHDEWHELLELLQKEINYHLQDASDKNSIEELLAHPKHKHIPAHVIHTLREYADVLFYKLKDINKSLDIYCLLVKLNPDDRYSINVLFEIIEHHAQTPHIFQKVLRLLASDEGGEACPESEFLDDEGFAETFQELYVTRSQPHTEDWLDRLKALKARVKLTSHARVYMPLLDALRK